MFCFSMSNHLIQAQTSQDSVINRKIYNTARIQGTVPTIDGLLDEDVWSQVEWGTDFQEYSPNNSEKPYHQTAFKILYDEKYLYVGFKCYDSEPDSIVSRMSRRDGFEGDWVEINLDSYHDLQSGFSFTSSVSGVKGDEAITNQFNWDSSYNPIWYLKTSIDKDGWIAEIKIPFSQLRFTSKDEQIWGLQVNRRHFRDGSLSKYQPIPNNAPYLVRGFAELHGIRGILPQKQKEIQPYVLGKVETYEPSEGNPFADGTDIKLNAGVDGKIGISNNVILDFTINPDFGQVEADPSQLRLDGYEVFFSERRPFFVEGAGIFNSRITNFNVWGSFNSDRLFYSRRIGGSPKGYPNTTNGEYSYIPDNTTILGAAKVSGRTEKGMSFGILESITQQEKAIIDNEGTRREEMVEPLTNYFVGRAKQDFNGNNTILGVSFNAVNRNLNNSDMAEWLHDQAYTGGLDIAHQWKQQKWFVKGNLSFSQIQGTSSAILNKQTGFLHSFDRPDAEHLQVDSTATSLFGHAGTAQIGKQGGKFMFTTGLTWRSPKLDLNDIGFMSNTDEITHGFWVGYRLLKPKGIARSFGLNFNSRSSFDFSGRHLGQMNNVNGWLEFNNFWNINAGLTYASKRLAKRALFGGPILRQPNALGYSLGIRSDSRKKFSMGVYSSQDFIANQAGISSYFEFWAGWQPLNALSISVAPSYSINKDVFQYITSMERAGKMDYIGGTLDQKTLSITTRVNYNITPDLTIQYYGSPFISQGAYSDFKSVIKPLGRGNERFDIHDDLVVYNAESDSYYFDMNGNKIYEAGENSFSNPDFSFIQFRSNLVARWEYVPGSEIYLVWSQNTSAIGDVAYGLVEDFNKNIVQDKGRNIFLLKWTYRFLL